VRLRRLPLAGGHPLPLRPEFLRCHRRPRNPI
jgi:hypothetical protein